MHLASPSSVWITTPERFLCKIRHGGVPLSGYWLKYFGIRGGVILWSYADYDGELRQHLLVAKLDDPDGAATTHLLDLETTTPTPERVVT